MICFLGISAQIILTQLKYVTDEYFSLLVTTTNDGAHEPGTMLYRNVFKINILFEISMRKVIK